MTHRRINEIYQYFLAKERISCTRWRFQTEKNIAKNIFADFVYAEKIISFLSHNLANYIIRIFPKNYNSLLFSYLISANKIIYRIFPHFFSINSF